MSSNIRESLTSLEKLINHISREKGAMGIAPSFGAGKENEELRGYTVPADERENSPNVLEINGDVEFKNGQINHVGDIVIKGNVESGAVVRTSHNIIIEGMIENASVNAGGNITVSGGIRGGDAGNVVANGSLTAEFVENGSVSAGGNIYVNYIIDSTVTSDGVVVVDGKGGFISGGKTSGLMGVSARELGNDMEEPTIVMAGYSSEYYSHYLDMTEKETDLSERLSDTVHEITKIVRNIRNKIISHEDAAIDLERLNAEKDFCFQELDNVRFDIKQIEERLRRGKGRDICASETVYPGTILEIEGSAFRIPATTSYVRYFCEGNKIVSKVFS